MASLSGFRDYLANDLVPRHQMLAKIKDTYETYGFTPLETPAIERYETLQGKYGEEGEKLMYRFQDHGKRELALRYDLTVPLARVVAQHQNDLVFPYKRYQVGPVWRGESPQAGRYREFLQFDADVVGAPTGTIDAEIVAMMVATMRALGAKALVRVNNRLILDGLMEILKVDNEDLARKVIGWIDKIDKVGHEAVINEITSLVGSEFNKIITTFLRKSASNDQQLDFLASLVGSSEKGSQGVRDLKQVWELLKSMKLSEKEVLIDPSIARGLNYYTGIIFETNLVDLPSIGSVCSGGRYDNLIAALGGPNLPAIGTSVGVDRLLAGLQELGLIASSQGKVEVLVTQFSHELTNETFELAAELRQAGIRTDLYPQVDKLGRQFKHADRLGVKWTVILGPDEIANDTISLRNMETGQQSSLERKALLDQLLATRKVLDDF